MPKRVRAFVAEAMGVLGPANAEGIKNKQKRTGHDEEKGLVHRGTGQDRH
jgi:hypothetical protein